MKKLLVLGILALAAPAYAADIDIEQERQKQQIGYDAAHPGDHKGCVTAFFSQIGEFLGFRTVPEGEQFVIRGTHEIRTCQNGKQQIVSNQPQESKRSADEARSRGAFNGQDQAIDYFYSLYPDCSSMGYPAIRVVKSPEHGTITTAEGEANPTFSKENQRAACNTKKAPVIFVHYTSTPGYIGPDGATVEILFPAANIRTIRYTFDVR